MEIWKNIILGCYLIALFLEIAGITIVILAGKKRKTKRNDALRYFMIGLLGMSLYDMWIYYANYSFAGIEDILLLRIGISIIAILFFLWLHLQRMIMECDEFAAFNKNVMVYTIVYAIFWLLSSIIIPFKAFYTLRWILLVSDLILILLMVVGSVVYISKAVTSHRKYLLQYMVIVTAMLTWNFASYFWGEGSVHWGNSRFIREPIDLTIIFWFAVNIANIYFIYHEEFRDAYREEKTSMDLDEKLEGVAKTFELTLREKDLVKLIYEGKSNGEIAKELYISESTVKTHVYNIYKKLNIKNRGGVNQIINCKE